MRYLIASWTWAHGMPFRNRRIRTGISRSFGVPSALAERRFCSTSSLHVPVGPVPPFARSMKSFASCEKLSAISASYYTICAPIQSSGLPSRRRTVPVRCSRHGGRGATL